MHVNLLIIRDLTFGKSGEIKPALKTNQYYYLNPVNCEEHIQLTFDCVKRGDIQEVDYIKKVKLKDPELLIPEHRDKILYVIVEHEDSYMCYFYKKTLKVYESWEKSSCEAIPNIGKEESSTYKLGDIFKNETGDCLLAQIDTRIITVISIKNGNRCFDGIEVSDVTNITEEDLLRLDENFFGYFKLKEPTKKESHPLPDEIIDKLRASYVEAMAKYSEEVFKKMLKEQKVEVMKDFESSLI